VPGAYRSRISLTGPLPGTEVLVVRRGASLPVALRIDHEGTSVWPAQPANGTAPVTLGMRWLRRDGGPALAEQRVLLPYDLQPREQWWPAPDLGAELPATVVPGDYELEIGLVQEGVTWFADRGDGTLRLPVRVDSIRR
jgi:hypothetical protein